MVLSHVIINAVQSLAYNTELIQHIKGVKNRNKRYINSSTLDKTLSKPIKNLGNLEYIAKDLALSNPNHIIADDLLLYSKKAQNDRPKFRFDRLYNEYKQRGNTDREKKNVRNRKDKRK
ncbi:30967_t:CDS:2 [Gigaspora margarita]|uniref:30967_t:CDS:1 n=1 Tax=Gigaspora margarita TaxID=4874 RepID=A0ABM8VVW5_GIGMA|nr:30967_t:CDS:2 [Gigaspora margarita]